MVLQLKKKFERKISLTKDARDGILSFCKMNHPNEGILILRGKQNVVMYS